MIRRIIKDFLKDQRGDIYGYDAESGSGRENRSSPYYKHNNNNWGCFIFFLVILLLIILFILFVE